MADLNVKVGLDRSGFQTGLAAMENAATGFGRNLGGLLAGAFSFTAITQQVTAAISQAGRLQDLSDTFGISAESLQRIGNAAEESGGSIEDVGRALAKIGVGAQQAFAGNEQLAASFAAIGVRGQDLISLSPEQLFYRLAAAMKDGSLAGKDLAVAKDLLGRGFTTLMPVLQMTEEQIRAVGEAAGIMSDDAVAKLDAFGDSWGRLSNKVKIKAAEIIDASIRLGEELMANPMGLFGDWQEIEKRIDARQKKDKEARDSLRRMREIPEDAAASAVIAASESNKATRERQRSEDDYEHEKAMRRAKDRLEQIAQENDARRELSDALQSQQDRELTALQKILKATEELAQLKAEMAQLDKNSAEGMRTQAEIIRKQVSIEVMRSDMTAKTADSARDEAEARQAANAAMDDISSIQAQRRGDDAVLRRQKEITRELGQKARATGDVFDALKLEQAKSTLQGLFKNQLEALEVDPKVIESLARQKAEGVGGRTPKFTPAKPPQVAPPEIPDVPSFKAPNLSDLPKAPNLLDQFIPPMGPGLKDGAQQTSPRPVDDTKAIKDDTAKCVERLDKLIELSGTFSY